RVVVERTGGGEVAEGARIAAGPGAVDEGTRDTAKAFVLLGLGAGEREADAVVVLAQHLDTVADGQGLVALGDTKRLGAGGGPPEVPVPGVGTLIGWQGLGDPHHLLSFGGVAGGADAVGVAGAAPVEVVPLELHPA